MKLYRRVIVPFTIFLIALSIFTIFYKGVKGPVLTNDGQFSPVFIQGTVSIDGGPFIPLDPDRDFDMSGRHTYLIRGHFSRDIEKNHQIMMRISDLAVWIQVNGQEIFSFGVDAVHSGGNVWQFFTSPGISACDSVEIKLYNVYTKVHPRSINQFLTEIRFGSLYGLYQMAFRQNGFSMLVGFLIFVIGLCEAVIGMALLVIRQEGVNRVFISAGFAVFSGIWFSIQFNIISLLIPYPAAVATADVLSPYFMSIFFSLYISTYLTGRLRICGWVNAAIFLAYTGGCLVRFLGGMDAYHTVTLGWTLAVLDLASCLVYLVLEYRKAHSRRIRLFGISLAPIFVGTMLDAVGFGAGFANETMWLRFCFLLFVLIQLTALMNQLRENARQTERLKSELIQNRISVMLSQIQPHFLYNTLAAISRLCDEDSRKAKAAIVRFSKYLRGNLDALTQNVLIPFEKELSHVQIYLSLEKIRFENLLEVVLDINVKDFFLPVLTVQPLAENAIRYGISRKENGGTLRISTWEAAESYLITVSDDGVGFDSSGTAKDGRSHVGIENVRNRLMAQCGGTLSIVSKAGEGTTATIRLPKKDSVSQDAKLKGERPFDV